MRQMERQLSSPRAGRRALNRQGCPSIVLIKKDKSIIQKNLCEKRRLGSKLRQISGNELCSQLKRLAAQLKKSLCTSLCMIHLNPSMVISWMDSLYSLSMYPKNRALFSFEKMIFIFEEVMHTSAYGQKNRGRKGQMIGHSAGIFLLSSPDGRCNGLRGSLLVDPK